MENPIIKMTVAFIDVTTTFKDAKEDGHITLVEWAGLVKESVDFIKSCSKVNVNDFKELNALEIQILADVAMGAYKGDMITRQDVVDMLTVGHIIFSGIERRLK